MRILFVILLAGCALSGCAMFAPPAVCENPVLIPANGCDLLWDQIVDVVDDYFEIDREERPKRAGDVMTAGRIDTLPQVSATLLEPWRGDTADSYERLESTLQSIRRRAVVQVIPSDGAYLVDIAVYKELEDLKRPDFAPTSAATFRTDNSLSRAYTDPVADEQVPTAGWIPLGRDPVLEKLMISKIVARARP